LSKFKFKSVLQEIYRLEQIRIELPWGKGYSKFPGERILKVYGGSGFSRFLGGEDSLGSLGKRILQGSFGERIL